MAGTFESNDDPASDHPDCAGNGGLGYVADYILAIESYGIPPAVWSWHPYVDMENAYAGNFSNATTADMAGYINAAYAIEGWSAPRFWLTEAGVHLGSGDPNLVGNPIGQATSAEDFLNLQYTANQASTGRIPVARRRLAPAS